MISLFKYAVILFCITATAFGQAIPIYSDTIQLKEVVIKNIAAITIVNDTMTYHADSFKSNYTYVVEDLLKRMPGIDVSINGKILVKGKEVTRIFVNGVEMPVSDIRFVTQNVPSDIIEKVKVIELNSESDRLKAI